MNKEHELENVHQRYVNAERGDEGIPEYFRDQLNSDPRNNLIQEAVFRELWYSDDPIHSLGSLESKFDEGRQTVGARLDEMVEQGVLKKASINNGDYWWIKFPNSEYPLPKDILVHPEPEQVEMGVDDFFTQPHIVTGAVALLATAIGGALVLFGALQLNGDYSIPVPTDAILAYGLTTLFVSYIFLLLAVVVWFVNKLLVANEGFWSISRKARKL